MKELVAAFEHLAQALERNVDEFTHLDSEAGDGDLGLTAGKIAGGIRKALEDSKRKKRFSDIVGGIGYIIGLMGLILYFYSRQRKK